MIPEGEEAPTVELPAYVDGERRRIDLDDYLGEGIVVLAFYPADFNPACTMQASDLDDLDLFTMQKDVSVFAVSPDSTYSHAAFAERYGLHLPLVSDPDGAAAEAYGVATETDIGERLVERAVFVVDHRGVVQYAWVAPEADAEIDAAPIKQAVGDIGGDDTALERYRVGYDHYVEGREAFTEAMGEYENREWMVAFNGFEAAEPAFTAAADHFDTAVRFAETEDFETVVDRGEEKADTLQHAADWLADSADALASGRGKQGKEFRADADRLLEAASNLPDPPAPDAFTLTDDGIELADSVVVDPDADDGSGYDWRAGDDDAVDADLGIDDADLDAAVADDADESAYDSPDESDAVEGDLEMDLDAAVEADDGATAAGDDGDAGGATAGGGSEAGDERDRDAIEPAGPDGTGATGGESVSGGESASGGSSIEGDTVEGDLEMDFDAIEAADDPAAGEGSAGGEHDQDSTGDETVEETAGTDAGSAGAAGGESETPVEATPAGAGDDVSLTRGESSPDPPAGNDERGAPSGRMHDGSLDATRGPEHGRLAESDTTGTDDSDSGGAGPDDPDDDGADTTEEIEELDLADPTEGDDEADEDEEREDWDIPGQ